MRPSAHVTAGVHRTRLKVRPEYAADAHVTSPHFKKAQADLPQYLVETHQVRNVVMPEVHWDRLTELEVA